MSKSVINGSTRVEAMDSPERCRLWMVAMEEKVREFIEDAAQDLVGLDVALFFQANPRAFDTASGVALRTHRAVGDVEPALERLSEQGYLDVLTRGDGRYEVYALSPTPEVWRVLCRVSEAYHENPVTRKEIILMLVQRRLRDRGNARPRTPGSGSDV